MGKYEDRVSSHPLNASLAAAIAAVDQFTDEQRSAGAEDVHRLLWVLQDVQTRLRTASALAVTQSSLDQGNQQVQAIANEVANFRANQNLGHIVNANTNADAVLDLFRGMAPPVGSAKVGALEKEVESVRKTIASVLTVAQEGQAALTQAATTASDALAAKEVEFQSTSAELRAELEALSATTTAKVTELDSLITAQTGAFDTAEATRQAAFTQADAARDSKLAAAAKRHEEAHAGLQEDLRTRATSTIAELDSLREKAERVVGGIGVLGVAAGYNETAIRETTAARWWRGFTAASSIAAVVVLASSYWIDHSKSGSWPQLITRLAITAAIGGLAGWCGRQAADHRRAAKSARERHVQLASLDAYLANLDPTEASQVKLALAAGYFVPMDGRPSSSEAIGTSAAPTLFLQVLDSIRGARPGST